MRALRNFTQHWIMCGRWSRGIHILFRDNGVLYRHEKSEFICNNKKIDGVLYE